MHPGMEALFRLREECDLEIDPDIKTELYSRFHQQLEQFLRQHHLEMTHADFLAATRDDYRNWRRNPH
jgi:hypothetical protein